MSTYRIGTVTVNNGSTAVTGSGTSWVAASIRAGDFLFVNGLFGEIASVESNTALTLVRGWPGSNASGQQYSIALIDDGQRSIASLNQVLQALGSGNLTSLAGLNAGANQMPYFTGAGVMGLTNLTAAGRAILALTGSSGAKVPVVTASGTAALRDIVGTVSQSGGVPTGAIIQRGSNSNGEFVRFADGTQICIHAITNTDFEIMTSTGSVFTSGFFTWVFPAAFSSINQLALGGSVSTGAGALVPVFGLRPGTPTQTQSVFRHYAAESGIYTIPARLYAIGRWY